jgi:hypothetical protein
MKNIELQAYVAKKEIEIAKLQVVQQFGSLLQQVNKKNKSTVIAGLIIEKAAAVAMIWANNAIANAKAVATFWITGGLPWTAINTISAALSTAAVVLQTKNAIQEINSQGDSVPVPDTGGGGTPPNTGGGSGSGGSMPTTGGGTPPNTGGGGGGGNTGGGGNGGGGGTVRAYVVQSDIEDAQQRESEIQNRARFE